METPKATQRQDLAVPADKATRDRICRALESHGFPGQLAPPLALVDIEACADRVMRDLDLDPSYRGFVILLVGNGVWRETVAATPYSRRILLLPQCLRSSTACAATFDSLGLLCEGCGRCSIDTIQQEAEELGYVVLVAEGTTAVSELVTRGEADAVIGVSCMDALEKFFHPLNANAVPGLAVPLFGNGCVDTRVDLDWLRETLRLRGPDHPAARRLNLQGLRREVRGWFEPGVLAGLLGGAGTATEAIALDWLARDGKRWRPTLTAGAFQALAGSADAIPDRVRKVAVAVECFHKASLIHDDLEDDDDIRYGTPTFHRQHGAAVAINAGDLLVGEGYRMLAQSGASPAQMARMLAAASAGHRTLCIGQGEELLLRASPERLTVPVVLGIFQRKTAPAYDIALQLGAICADADAETCAVLTAYSEALGIAYQIRDDLADLAAPPVRGAAGQASLLAALARETFPVEAGAAIADIPAECIRDPRVEQRARLLLKEYADRALRALAPLRQAALKSLLYRVVSKIVDPAP
jgi:geranylgeranyl pyrophosphate synthase